MRREYWAVLIFHPYLEGSCFKIGTDHDALRCILNMWDVTGKLVRWLIRLLEVTFDGLGRAGVKHKGTDALAWLLASGADNWRRNPPLLLESTRTTTLQGDNPTGCYILLMDCVWGDQIPKHYSHREIMTINDDEGQNTVPSTAEFLGAQENDRKRRQICSNFSTQGLNYTYDRHEFLARRSTMDGSLQNIVPVYLSQTLLWFSHYLILARHPGDR